MKYKNALIAIVQCGFLLAFASGCTHLVPIAVRPTALPSENKLPLHAVLVLNKDLADFKHEFHMMGDVRVYPFGAPIQNCARQVTSASFQQVDEAASEENAFANQSADIVLIPRAVKAEQSQGITAFDNINMTLVVEWTAKDRKSQDTVWLKTLTADASEVQGNIFSGGDHQKILMQKLFDDLGLKTRDAFQKSSELRNLTH